MKSVCWEGRLKTLRFQTQPLLSKANHLQHIKQGMLGVVFQGFSPYPCHNCLEAILVLTYFT